MGSRREAIKSEWSSQMMRRQAERMMQRIAQLYRLSCLERGKESAAMERLELGAAVYELCTERYGRSICDHITVQDGIYVMADRVLLGQLLTELVDNALRFVRRNGTVQITVSMCDEGACLSVKDDGIGIACRDQAHVWEPFYRTEAARTRGDSAGLGLTVVASIARILGAEITLRSRVGAGCTVSLYLPAVD